MTWLFWKAKLAVAGAALLAFIAFFLRFQAVKNQRDRAIEKARNEKARADQAIKVGESDDEIDQEYSDLEREAKQDIENGDVPENLSDSNRW